MAISSFGSNNLVSSEIEHRLDNKKKHKNRGSFSRGTKRTLGRKSKSLKTRAKDKKLKIEQRVKMLNLGKVNRGCNPDKKACKIKAFVIKHQLVFTFSLGLAFGYGLS